MKMLRILSIISIVFVCLKSILWSGNDPFSPTAEDLERMTKNQIQELELNTWVFTIYAKSDYPPGTSEDYNPLSFHDDTYCFQEFSLIDVIQKEGINLIEDKGFRLSLSETAISAVSVMRPYKYDIVVTSSKEKLELIENLFDGYGGGVEVTHRQAGTTQTHR